MSDERSAERLPAAQCVPPPGPGPLDFSFAGAMARLAHLAYCRFEEDGPEELTQKLAAGQLDLRKTFNSARTGSNMGLQAFLCEGPCYAALVFRGTTDLRDWYTNVQVSWKKVSWDRVDYQVHTGFYDSYAQMHAEIEREVGALRARKPSLDLLLVGHSLGGAQAQIATPSLVHHRPRYCVTFGSPKISDGKFRRCFTHTKHYRVENGWDIVPSLPNQGSFYVHCGDATHLRSEPEPSLRARPDRYNWWIDFRSTFGLASLPGWKGVEDHDIKNYRDRLGATAGRAG